MDTWRQWLRRCAMLWVLLGIALQSALAGFHVRKSTYRPAQFEEAKAEAAKYGRSIAVVFSDENTTCPLCEDATLLMMDEFKARSVLVYADTAKDSAALGLLPPLVRRALTSREAGGYIPRTVAVDPDVTEVLAIVPYVKSSSDQEDLISKAKRAIDAAMKDRKKPAAKPSLTSLRASGAEGAASSAANAASVALAPDRDVPLDEARPPRTWTSVSGSRIEAALTQTTSSRVQLKSADGKAIEIDIQRLSEADRQYIDSQRPPRP